MKVNDLPEFSELIEGDRVVIVRADGLVGIADHSLLGGNSGTEEPPPEPTIQAFQFVGSDSTSQGNWGGIYGSLGYILFAWNDFGVDQVSLPANITGYTKDASRYSYGEGDIRALPGTPDNAGIRKASVLYGAEPSVSVSVSGSEIKKVSIYMCDYDNNRGTITARIESLADASKFAEKALTAEEYNNGIYCQFTYSGGFKIKVFNPENGNNTFSALFFD